MSKHDPVRTTLFCDDPFAHDGLRRALEELGLILDDLEPETVLWDLGPSEPGELPDLGLPILALAPDGERARVALAMGVEGVLLRALDGQRIPAALAAVAEGLRVIDPAFSDLLPRPAQTLPEALTARERQTLAAMAQGLSNRGIARSLGVSEHTVKFHVNGVLEKLNARNRTDAVVRGIRFGVLSL